MIDMLDDDDDEPALTGNVDVDVNMPDAVSAAYKRVADVAHVTFNRLEDVIDALPANNADVLTLRQWAKDFREPDEPPQEVITERARRRLQERCSTLQSAWRTVGDDGTSMGVIVARRASLAAQRSEILAVYEHGPEAIEGAGVRWGAFLGVLRGGAQ